MVAEVIINTIAKELNKTYDYIIPDSILNQIKIHSPSKFARRPSTIS